MNRLDFVDQASLRDDIPAFSPGDTINVHVKVIEGAKERVQVFKGVVIRRQGGGIREPFPFLSPDPHLNRASARRLAALRPSLICFGHGPPLRDSSRFTAAVERLPA